jgi:hypothetical protein
MQRLPSDARIVIWHGAQDPWGAYARQIGWVRQHYRAESEVVA